MGNMISDFVKGNKKFDYPIPVQNGITLHRLIDEFTDNHLATKNAKKIFNHELGLYAGAYVDIVFDYFLANDVNEFADEIALQNFAANTYSKLDEHYDIFPATFQLAFTSMKQHNWFINYRKDAGIQRSFENLTRRAKYVNKNHFGFEAFIKNKKNLKVYYDIFFKDLKQFVLQQHQLL